MKKLYIFLLSLLLLALTGVGVYSLVDEDPTTSALENRELAKMPEFSAESLLDGSFVQQLSTYFSDTFPGREALLQANRNLNQFYYFSGTGEESLLVVDFESDAAQGGEALKDPDLHPEQETIAPVVPQPEETPEESVPEQTPSDTPPVEEPPETTPEETAPPTEETVPPVEEPPEEAVTAVGTIIIRGSNAMDIPTATESLILRYGEAINNLHEAMGEDLQIISLLTPNSGQFYSPEDFHTGIHDQKLMIELCYGAMDENVWKVDAYSALQAHQEEYIYFRTDHHWTALGAYYAYTALCETMGWEAVPLEQFETGSYENFLGSMYTWTSGYAQSEMLKNNPDTLTYYLPVVETHARYYADASLEEGYPVSVVYQGLKETESNKYLCFLGGDHPAAVVETSVEDGPVCLLLKESYGNALIPFLTSHYSKIIVIDPREFNRPNKPDLDLAAFAEEQQVDDLLVVNYPFMINNLDYIKWLNRLVGLDME